MNRKAPEGCSEVENCGNPKLGRSDLARGSILPSVQFDCRYTLRDPLDCLEDR
jgi:hypothetical protein